MIHELHAKFGGHIQKQRAGKKNQQDSLSWEILDREGIVKMLTDLEPLLIIKRKQAQLCLWWFANCAGRHVPEPARRAFNEELKLMKRDPQRLSEEAVAHITSLMR